MSSYGSIARASLNYGACALAPIVVDYCIQKIPDSIFSKSVRNLIAYTASAITGYFIWDTQPPQRTVVMVVAYTAYKALEWGKTSWSKQSPAPAAPKNIAIQKQQTKVVEPAAPPAPTPKLQLPKLILTPTRKTAPQDPAERKKWALVKGWKNAEKAIKEHRLNCGDQKYATVEEGLPPLQSLTESHNLTPLTLEMGVAEHQGPRRTMEDAHFYEEIPQGVVTGVLDGHTGSDVAQYVSKFFVKVFEQALGQTQGDVHQAFEISINSIQAHLPAEWNDIGSTSVISFIDMKSHLIYTFTLGDSEANVYRKIKGEMKSIPISCVRNWASKKDAQRFADFVKKPEFATELPKRDPKGIRFPFDHLGAVINVSRSFGDKSYTQNGKEGVIQKSKITVNQLREGDVLILACDGLKDYVKENEIIGKVEQIQDPKLLAKELTEFAIDQKKSSDNVTVLAIKIK